MVIPWDLTPPKWEIVGIQDSKRKYFRLGCASSAPMIFGTFLGHMNHGCHAWGHIQQKMTKKKREFLSSKMWCLPNKHQFSESASSPEMGGINHLQMVGLLLHWTGT